MLIELDELFDSLQSVFDLASDPRNMVTLAFSEPGQTAALTISGTTLTTATTGGGVVLTYNLEEWTIDRLVEDINTKAGYTATVLNPSFNKMMASVFLDDIKSVDLGAAVNLRGATNPIWILLKPLAIALKNRATDIDSALTQLNILTARGHFADLWGRVLGVVRKEGEADAAYMQRVVNRILLLRANNAALSDLVKDELGINVEVKDLWPEVLNFNNRVIFSKIAGRVYNVGNFIVEGDPGGQALIDLIERHKAAGTRAFFRERIDTAITDTDPTFTIDIINLSLFDTLFADREFSISIDVDGDISEVDTGLQSWVVGITPMPGSKIAA